MVPTAPSDALAFASGTLDLGNCLFQTYWSGLSPGAHALDASPAEMSPVAVPLQAETEGGTRS